MINELYDLSRALNGLNISTQSWHKKYQKIPKIQINAPCIKIELDEGKIIRVSEIKESLGAILRKYGTKQGSYPCMNFVPLYRVTDEKIKDEIDHITCEKIDLPRIRTWCIENNWNKNFAGKYKRSMEEAAEELYSKIKTYEPLKILLEESRVFRDVNYMYKELERVAFEMLEQKKDISLALKILFYKGDTGKEQKNDMGKLSVALEASKMIASGVPAISGKFVTEVNKNLLKSEFEQRDVDSVDAFGIPFAYFNESMPSVKLAGGFDVILRTMFREHKCQERYGRMDDASYPICKEMRMNVQASLDWLGSEENEGKTWTTIDKNEILFAYVLDKPNSDIIADVLNGEENGEETFGDRTKRFIEHLRNGKDLKIESNAEGIRIFVLRRWDPARTKVMYTKQTDAYELEKYSEQWDSGCQNIPSTSLGEIAKPFPLHVASTLNQFWKANGESISSKTKTIPRYHGIEILMDPKMEMVSDLHLLCEKAFTLAAYLGRWSAIKCVGQEERKKMVLKESVWNASRNILALMGLVLYRNDIHKEDYMESMPYLYGQLLKAADELHVLYCKVVRNGEIPPQLVGGSVFQSAAEMPVRTLNVLSQRMLPYYTWAKSYRWKGVETKGIESGLAGWLYMMCEKITTSLNTVWTPKTRFTEEEKAQLFIGYMAEFPKKEKSETTKRNEENKEDEKDGTEN